MNEHQWPSDWLRAVLPMVSLGILARGDAHGYAILQSLESSGLGSVQGGTLYPLLARQQELGRIDHHWDTDPPGPARKVFRLTGSGRRDLEHMRREWARLNDAITSAVPSPISKKEQK